MRLTILILLCACYFMHASGQDDEDTTDATLMTEIVTLTTETAVEETESGSTEPVTETTTKPLTRNTTDDDTLDSTTVTRPGTTSVTMDTDEPLEGSTDLPASSSSTVTESDNANITVLTDEPVRGSTDGPSTRSDHTEGPTTLLLSSPGTSEAASSSRPGTTKQTEPPASTRAPTYPEKTYPEVTGPSTAVFREIKVEVAVVSDSCILDDVSTEAECESLKRSFIDFVSTKYESVSGFQFVTVQELRSGSVIIQHTVYYNYNEMTVADKMLTPDEIYDKTVGPSVDNAETTDDFTFTECAECEEPADVVELCDPDNFQVDCEGYAVADCTDNVWVCQSPCASTEDPYCQQDDSLCVQGTYKEPAVCYCQQSEEAWYIGARCQVYIDRLGLITGFSIGCGALLILIIVLIVCLCHAKKEAKENSKLPYERTTEAFLSGQNDLELDQVRMSYTDGVENEAFDHPVQDGELDDNFNPKTGKHVSNPELEQVLQERTKQNGKNANEYFWGSVQNDFVKGYDSKPTSQNQLKRQSNNYAERGRSKPSGQYKQSAPIPPADYEPSDPFSKRYSKIVKDDYGSLSS